MFGHDVLRFDLALRDVGFGVLAVVATVLVVPVQLASMIAFDSTGLDTVAPDFVFMGLVPALAVAVVPGAMAYWLYGRGRALVVVGGLFVAYSALATYLIRFYGVCGGPAC